MPTLKPGINIIQKGALHFQLDQGNRPKRFQPWLGDAFAFLYDFFMARSVFPKKFRADIERHKMILQALLETHHNQDVLELGTGSGSAADFLPSDNHYVGTDISTGLLRIAVKRFDQAGFVSPSFYVASGEDLPFNPETFDTCLCVLSLNFIGHADRVFEGVYEVLRPGGIFTCCVPIPERKPQDSTIRGTLLTEVRLQKICQEAGFSYQRVDRENGTLLYFQAFKPTLNGD